MDKDGGRAFPNDGAWANNNPEGGMSLRDWLAGHAAGGLCASHGTSGLGHGPEDVAGRSYQIADAMLAEREKIDGPTFEQACGPKPPMLIVAKDLTRAAVFAREWGWTPLGNNEWKHQDGSPVRYVGNERGLRGMPPLTLIFLGPGWAENPELKHLRERAVENQYVLRDQP